MDKELKPCPFCGNNDVHISNYNIEESKWGLDHYCPYENGRMSIVISVYGKSKQEVINKWNKRIGDK